MSGCSQSDFGFRLDESSCGTQWRVYPLGEPVSLDVTYSGLDGECVEGDYLDDDPARPVGEETAPSALALADLEKRGDGRILGRWARLDDGSVDFRGWWDAEHDIRCAPRTLASGEVVCMPDPTAFVQEYEYYSDETCMQKASVVTSNDACADAPDLAYRLTDTCPGLELFHVAGPVEAELYTFDDATVECRPITDAERANLHAVGEPVDPDSFERVSSPSS